MTSWNRFTVHISNRHANREVVKIFGNHYDVDRIVPIPVEICGTRADGYRLYHFNHGDNITDQKLAECCAQSDQDLKNREQKDCDEALLERYGAYDWHLHDLDTRYPHTVHLYTMDDKVAIGFNVPGSFPNPDFRTFIDMFPVLEFANHAVKSGIGFACIFRLKEEG